MADDVKPRMVKIDAQPCTWLRDDADGTEIYSAAGKYYRVKLDMVEGKHQITEIAKPAGL